jgi:hypothetical protein
MATGTAGDFATHYASNQVHYLSKKFTLADALAEAAVTIGELPPYASVIGGGVHVVTAFDDSGTNTLIVGLADTYGVTANDDAFATALDLSAVGFIALDELAATTNIIQSTPARVTATYAGQNNNAAAGEAWVIVTFVVNRPAGGPN